MNIYQKKLAICKHSRIYFDGYHSNWDNISKIRDMVVAGNLKVTESIYSDSWEYDQKPFTDPKSTSTYDKCTELSIWNGEIKIDIWEGEMMYGDRRKHRSTFKLEGDWWLIPSIVLAVNNAYSLYAIKVQRAIEDAEFLARVSLMEDKLLNDFNPDEAEDE